jgi:peptidyl-prolyl cis-trans isomerase D
MITSMRRYRRTLQVGLLVVVAAFVASLFIFGSSGLDGRVARDGVATVNGEPIPVERYQRRYQEHLTVYAQMLGDRFSPDMAERLGLGPQVVEDLVQETLVVQRARAEGLAVGDDELNAHIHAFPAFQEGGRFTLRRYEDVLRRLGYTKASFEEEMRRRLTRQKVEHAVRGGAKVSEAEIAQAFAQQREEVRVAWALVETAPLAAAQTVTDEELAAHLKEHQADFREPERRRVQYVAVSPQAFTPTVSDAEVEKYFAEHAAEFEVPEQARASHLLVTVPETGGSAAEDEARARVAEAIARVKGGGDFARVAREVSQDPGTAQRGGELGWVKKGEMVPQFEEALFALGAGEVSPEPVRTPFGFHAIKVHEVRAASKSPLKEVAPRIRQRLQADAADRAARAKAEEARAKLIGAADFMAEARALGLQPVETTIARRTGASPFLPPDPMEETAFELTHGGTSTPVKTPGGWVVIRHVASLPAAVPPLEEIRDKVAEAVKRQKAETVAAEKARQLVAEARNLDFATAARKAGASHGETVKFSRARPAERLPGDVMLKALETPLGQLTEPVKAQQGYYVLEVLERVPADMSGLAEEREKIEREVLARKQAQLWESWIAAARSGAKIQTAALPTGVARR